MTSALPERAAAITAVSPRRSATFGLAPDSSSSCTIAELPFTLAIQIGVAPRSLAAFTLAPARMSIWAMARSSR